MNINEQRAQPIRSTSYLNGTSYRQQVSPIQHSLSRSPFRTNIIDTSIKKNNDNILSRPSYNNVHRFGLDRSYNTHLDYNASRDKYQPPSGLMSNKLIGQSTDYMARYYDNKYESKEAKTPIPLQTRRDLSPFTYNQDSSYYARNKTPTHGENFNTIDREYLAYRTQDHSGSQFKSRVAQQMKANENERKSRFNTPFQAQNQDLYKSVNLGNMAGTNSRNDKKLNSYSPTKLQQFNGHNQRNTKYQPNNSANMQPLDKSFVSDNNKSGYIKQSSIDQYEQNQKIIERAQKLIQDNTLRQNQTQIEPMRMNQSQIDPRLNHSQVDLRMNTSQMNPVRMDQNQMDPTRLNQSQMNPIQHLPQMERFELSKDYQKQNRGKERYDPVESVDINQSGQRSNWKPNMTQYSNITPNEMVQEVSNFGHHDSEEMRIENKLFKKVQEEGVNYNQRHVKYMNKLKEIEDRLQGMNPGVRNKSKSKSKSRTRKAFVHQIAAQYENQHIVIQNQEQDSVLPANKNVSSSESIQEQDMTFQKKIATVGIDQEITSINGHQMGTIWAEAQPKPKKAKKQVMKKSPQKVAQYDEEMVDGVEILVQPQITDTPAQLKTPAAQTPIKESVLSSMAKNPRMAKDGVRLSQNMLQIEKNERTPLNRKARNRVDESIGNGRTWVNDEDNVLMLSPEISTQAKVHPDDPKAIPERIFNEDMLVIKSIDGAIVPQKVNTVVSDKYEDYSEYSAQLLKQKIQSQHLNNQKVLEPKDFAVSPFRVQDEDTKGKKLQKHRIVILGSDGVGKTCLFLRYMYFDKSKGIQIKQTPGKDGHIFTKRIVGKQFVHEYEIWDFLSSDELEQKVPNKQYNIYEQNKDYISWADVILLVFDVNDLDSFKHCQAIGENLKQSKKVIYVANKCDNTDIEQSQIIQDAKLSNRHLLMTVSTKNTFGLKNLFTEVDGEYADDFVDKEPDAHTLTQQKFNNILVFKSDQQESISLQLAYISFRIDMRFHEDKQQREYVIRSIKGEKKLKSLTNINNINEILQKAAQMKSILQKCLDLALREELSNTVEFEYATQKFAQLNQVEEQLQSKSKSYQCKSSFLKGLSILIAIATFLSLVNYWLLDMPVSRATKQLNNVNEAESNLLKYHSTLINEAQAKIRGHQDLLENYQRNVQSNLNNLDKYQNANVTEMKTQILLIDQMVGNKLRLTESDFFNPQVLRKDLSELKTAEVTLKALGVNQDLLDLVQFSKTKMEFDSEINEIKVQGIMLKDASAMIYKSYLNYINIFKKKKDPHADDWMMLQHKQFNYKLQEVVRRFNRDLDSSKNLIKAVSQLKTPIAASATLLDTKIKQQATSQISTDQLKQKCEKACSLFQTKLCPNSKQTKQKEVTTVQQQKRTIMEDLIQKKTKLVDTGSSQTVNYLKRLDDDAQRLVTESTSREEALIKINIESIQESKVSGQQAKLYQHYTNAACGALIPESQTVHQQRIEAFQSQQSQALSMVYMLSAILSLLLVAMICRKGKKDNYFERETGADEADITAEENNRQSTTGSS